MYVHVLGQVVTIFWATQMYHMSMLMFIPIAGRTGGGTNPDVMVGINSVGLTLLITSYMVRKGGGCFRLKDNLIIIPLT